MLQPEKLRLSPDKYREKLEGINTDYQNARDIHEQEQAAYEAELYDIEHTRYEKILEWTEDYLMRSAECAVLGNFTDEVTVLGVSVQITLGILDLDLPCDIRDIIADIKNLAETDRVRWDLIGMLALDLIGLIPVIGVLKYSDEVGTLLKNAGKVSAVAEGADGVGTVARHADEAGAWLQGIKVFKYSDEAAESVASGEKLLKESQTVYESFADMMSPDDAEKYLDFLENGSREGLTSAELAGVEKADALLVSQKAEYQNVLDLRNVNGGLESGGEAVKSGIDTSWYKPDGSINYPPNNGAVPGTEVNMTLKPGGTLGRYGNIGEKSNFVTQTGAEASKLALPPNTNPAIYQEFEVIKEISGTIQAEIAPWGGSAGGGLQYELPKPILQLIKEGYIVPK